MNFSYSAEQIIKDLQKLPPKHKVSLKIYVEGLGVEEGHYIASHCQSNDFGTLLGYIRLDIGVNE